MGLLSRISAGFDTPAEESPLEQAGLSFFEFVKKYNFSHCAIFERVNTFYVFSHSYGFDGDTILQSISTSDFWEGTVEENKWNFFSRDENNLNTVLQFFSMNLKTSLPYVNIFYSKEKVLLTAFEGKPEYDDKLEKISKDFLSLNFENLKTEKTASSGTGIALNINVKEAASYALGNLNYEIKSIMEKAYITETFCSLEKLLDNQGSIEINGENLFSVSIETKSHLTKETVEAFLKNALESVYKDQSSLISYEY